MNLLVVPIVLISFGIKVQSLRREVRNNLGVESWSYCAFDNIHFPNIQSEQACASFGGNHEMIKTFGLGRNGMGLTWDERYPASYFYKRSEAIANLSRKLLERKTRLAMLSLFKENCPSSAPKVKP